MVDNTTPIDLTAVDPNLVAAVQKSINDGSDKAADILKSAGTYFQTKVEGAVVNFLEGLKTATTDTIGNLKNLGTAISGDTDLLNKFTAGYVALRTATNTTDLFSGIGKSSESFGTVSQQLKGMGSDWDTFIKKIPLGGGAVVQSMAKNAEAGEHMQNTMINMLSAGGNLNTLFDDTGKLTGDLTTQTLKYVNSLADVAEANGMSITSTVKYADAFNRIPGVMKENIFVGGNLNTGMSALSAAMKTMSGSGQDMETVLSAMNLAYENIGNSMGPVIDKGQKGLALFSMMSSLSKDLNLEFKETSSFLGDLAKQFKFVGDNTEAAAKIMMRFTDGLRNTGLTSGASLEIIKGMTKSVTELSIGTKAFVSARSGGPGGLQGAVQIDKLNREGKSDQVMQMVLDTLKQQMGGKIVTQAEGAQSQEAAAQFTKQKMLLQSGAFGNLVGSGPQADEKATRLLEALAVGDLGGAAKTSQQAINETASQGNSLQKQTNTILNKMSLFTERTALATQTLALNSLRENFGNRSPNGLALEKQMKEALSKTHFSDIENPKSGKIGYLSTGIGSDEKGGGSDLKRIQDLNYQKMRDTGSATLNSAFSGAQKMAENMKGHFTGASQSLLYLKKSNDALAQQNNILKNTLNQLTRGANPNIQNTAIRNATKNNTETQIKAEPTVVVVDVRAADGLKVNSTVISKDAQSQVKVLNGSSNGSDPSN